MGICVFSSVQGMKRRCTSESLRVKSAGIERWRALIQQLRATHQCSSFLPLACPRHPHQTALVSSESCNLLAGPFCHESCSYVFSDCHHACPVKCHSDPSSHRTCFHSCDIILPCSHQCTAKCCDRPCPPCRKIMMKEASLQAFETVGMLRLDRYFCLSVSL